jgi:hypothetical protein
VAVVLLSCACIAWFGLLAPRSAPADSAPVDPCFAAPVEGQKLQREGKLIEAGKRFAFCARPTCPSEIVGDCARWLGEVEAATPSVVFAARDAQRRDVFDVRVSIDGKPAVDVKSRAIPLDPGPHKVVFQHPGSADVPVDVMLREGEKNREVAASFVTSGGAVPASPRPGDAARAEHPIPPSVWIAGGTGMVAMAGFATFGALGISERGSDHCDTGCAQPQKDAVDTKFLIANISLGVGVVGLGVAAWLYLTRPVTERPASAFLDLRPLPGGGFAVVGSRF